MSGYECLNCRAPVSHCHCKPYDGPFYCGRMIHWQEGGTKQWGKRYKLKSPQAESTPPVFRYEVSRGPDLWMCDDCAKEAADWAELA